MFPGSCVNLLGLAEPNANNGCRVAGHLTGWSSAGRIISFRNNLHGKQRASARLRNIPTGVGFEDNDYWTLGYTYQTRCVRIMLTCELNWWSRRLDFATREERAR